VVDPEDHGVAEAQQTIAVALPQLSRAARGEVRGMVGAHDPMAAVQDALNLHGFDEIIMAMSPARISRWLRMDLARKVAALGVPVSTVLATDYGDADRTAA
jgi:hypothetical protein